MIKQLTDEHIEQFRNLIINMYSNLENLEWFSPMPFDYENVKGMINHPRFYIVGYFENDTLCGVGSLDYKCGKLIGKIDFPENCNTDKLVELGFHIVHTDHRGKGIMKKLVSYLLDKMKTDGFEWAFGKVHKDNFASSKSFVYHNFDCYCKYVKPVNKTEFISLSSEPFFSTVGKENAKQTLSKYTEEDENIIVDYNIWLKRL